MNQYGCDSDNPDAIRAGSVGNVTYEILHDESPESPRDWDNLGVVFCQHRRYNLSDKDAEDPRELDPKSIAVSLPIYMYDHGSISISTSLSYPYNDVWDAGQVGVIYVTRDQVLKEFGYKVITKDRRDQIASTLKHEIDIYDDYLRGNVYGYVIRDRYGLVIESNFGIYDLDCAESDARLEAGFASDNPLPVIYSLSKAKDQHITRQWLIRCDHSWMQPNRNDSILCPTLAEAFQAIRNHALVMGYDAIKVKRSR